MGRGLWLGVELWRVLRWLGRIGVFIQRQREWTGIPFW
jgi:hypothetical protein